jgi:hypothetical protein
MVDCNQANFKSTYPNHVFEFCHLLFALADVIRHGFKVALIQVCIQVRSRSLVGHKQRHTHTHTHTQPFNPMLIKHSAMVLVVVAPHTDEVATDTTVHTCNRCVRTHGFVLANARACHLYLTPIRIDQPLAVFFIDAILASAFIIVADSDVIQCQWSNASIGVG